jgi:glycosyltransferase involved in cell wall biosynthesis
MTVDRSEIEARARAEARVRDELARRGPLQTEVARLQGQAGPIRRLTAAIAGSRIYGLLAGDRSLPGCRGSEIERRAVGLRRERFRLSRRKRALDSGAGKPTGAAPGRTLPPRASTRASSFCIRIAGRDWEAAERGGDAALARSLARALGERGHRAVVQIDAESGDPLAAELDVLLALRGRPLSEPGPGRLNLIWQISHPEEADAVELNRYDRVLVASSRHAETLAGELSVPVEPLPQFTDPELFHPVPPSEPKHDLLFVGNWRGEFRQIVWDAIQAGRPPALYGEGWDLLAPEHAVAEHVPHAELHRLYSSCGILLVDHWEDMRRLGFVSNKVFDALACGAFLIADDNPALAEELPGAVETYSSPADLREKIDRCLADPEARERIARRGQEIVLAEHSVGRRAEALIAIAERGTPGGDASATAAAARGVDAGRA